MDWEATPYKLRGMLGNAVTWGVTWSIWAFLVIAVGYVLGPHQALPFLVTAPLVVMTSALIGFLGGAVFSGILGILYRRRSLEELSAPGLALWGAVAGCLIPVSLLSIALQPLGLPPGNLIGPALLVFGVPGLVTAFATVKLAQSARSKLDTPDSGPLTLPRHVCGHHGGRLPSIARIEAQPRRRAPL